MEGGNSEAGSLSLAKEKIQYDGHSALHFHMTFSKRELKRLRRMWLELGQMIEKRSDKHGYRKLPDEGDTQTSIRIFNNLTLANDHIKILLPPEKLIP